MSRAGSNRYRRARASGESTLDRVSTREDGFTLFEMLVVMTIIVLAMGSMSVLYRKPSGASIAKTAALMTASHLRDARANAMSNGAERRVEFVPSLRLLRHDDQHRNLRLDPSIQMSVTSADSERRSPDSAGIRFFPNGSSTGATITLTSDRYSYEVRVNWLTGRVSANAL